MALWFAVAGATGVVSVLLAWPSDGDKFQVHGAWIGLGQSALYLPAAGLIWLVSDWLAARVFPETPNVPATLTRADLWSTATLCIGLYLLTQALSQLVYWVVVWRTSIGTAFWTQMADWRTDSGIAYQVEFRGQLGETLARAALGIACIAGPDRIRGLLARLRREAFGTTLVDDTDAGSSQRS
jgi:hypothetical protein